MGESALEVVSELVNLDQFTLAMLDSCDDDVFDSALAQLLNQIDTPITSAGGHNS